MRKLIAKWQFEYEGRTVKADQSFNASDSDAELMLARGSVVEDNSEPGKKRGYKRRDMTAEAP